ncbi:MAG: NifU family protein [Candidatus Sungbacteria bacterium]|nr:NifU family protein [Candidatus Sungbacteria bacterium]
MKDKVEKVLDELRPLIAQHHGSIELAGFEDGVVRVRLMGACRHCALSSLTLKAGVEELLKERVPGVVRVEAVE